jgi:PAS domain S-box-containing protein
METMIYILHLEDDPADVKLVQAKLDKAGLASRITCVQTCDDFEAALCNGRTDIILADLHLPKYDGMSALRLVLERCPEIPFIFVSGIMGEEAAIDALTQGATDYVLKQNLSRLASAVKRALQEAENRRERERVQRALEKSEAKMRDILDLLDEGVLVINRQYRILSVNKAFCNMVNQSENQVLGLTCHEVSHSNANPCFESGQECPIRYALETGKSGFATHTHKDGSGAQQYIELKSYPIIDASGTVISVIETLNNVTEKIKLQDQLQQTRKLEAIGTLVGGIAHDFNNILSSVIGYTEIALDHELPQDAPARGSLENVLTAALRARDLVKQIMAFSRRTQYEKKPISLMPIVKEALKLIRASLPSNIEIGQNVVASKSKILGDPAQIHQVFINLCTNAEHAMRKNGGILDVVLSTVEFSHADPERPPDLNPGAYALLAVKDTGHGIAPSVLDQIFDPFFTSKSKEEGTGLGLSVVHGIVKEHGGAIKVDSQPGQGTTFKIYFPLLDH